MITAVEVRDASQAFCQAVDDLGPLQRPDSVLLVTPAGTLQGDQALEIFEAIQRRRS